MSEISFIITKKEDLKSIVFEWLEEHPISKALESSKNVEQEKPMSRAELAEYLSISKVTVTDWMKKGLPYRRMHGRVYFIKEEVMAAMGSFNHRRNRFGLQSNDSRLNPSRSK